MPALSVWSLTSLANGDLACGCSDNLIWVFTRDEARAADAATTADYEARLANRVKLAPSFLCIPSTSSLTSLANETDPKPHLRARAYPSSVPRPSRPQERKTAISNSSRRTASHMPTRCALGKVNQLTGADSLTATRSGRPLHPAGPTSAKSSTVLLHRHKVNLRPTRRCTREKNLISSSLLMSRTTNHLLNCHTTTAMVSPAIELELDGLA